MLDAFCVRVDLPYGHAELVGQIQLPEAVRADDMSGEPLTLARQPEAVAIGANQAFTLEPLQHAESARSLTLRAPWSDASVRRLAGGRLAEQMLQRVLGLFAAQSRLPVAPRRQDADARPDDQGNDSQHDEDGEGRCHRERSNEILTRQN